MDLQNSLREDATVTVLRPEDDPRAVEKCCETIALAFESEPNNEFFCADPSLYGRRWRAIAYNTLLRSRGVPIVHVLQQEEDDKKTSCSEGQQQQQQQQQQREVLPVAMLAYQYPEQKVPDDAPEPPGIIDLAGTSRPETVPVRDDLLSYMSTKKAEFLKAHGSFEYIAFLATRPEYWGRGLGSRLLRYVTDRADAGGRWCYLEATNDANVRLYERHGFRQLETKTWTLDSVPGKRLLLVLMARPPVVAVSTHP